MAEAISIYEVGPRDGLQSFDREIPLRHRVKLVKKLKQAGISHIEVGSLVHPSILPMRQSEKLYRKTGGDLLVLNQRGLQRALVAGAKEVNVSVSPFDRFMRLNQNMSYDEGKLFYERLATQIPINRLYISCCFSSEVTKNQVLECIMWGKSLAKWIVLCDTDSNAAPEDVFELCSEAKELTDRIAVHFHTSKDLESCMKRAYEAGVRVYDTSIGGLGGCFSIDDAEGNVPTEALVGWAEHHGIPIEQQIDVRKLTSVSNYAHNLSMTKRERVADWLFHKVGVYL